MPCSFRETVKTLKNKMVFYFCDLLIITFRCPLVGMNVVGAECQKPSREVEKQCKTDQHTAAFHGIYRE